LVFGAPATQTIRRRPQPEGPKAVADRTCAEVP
jgi:hypothetical protein